MTPTPVISEGSGLARSKPVQEHQFSPLVFRLAYDTEHIFCRDLLVRIIQGSSAPKQKISHAWMNSN